jgi:hypothetical protein
MPDVPIEHPIEHAGRAWMTDDAGRAWMNDIMIMMTDDSKH